MVKQALHLALIASICGGLLVAVDWVTADTIKLNREARARALMTQMLRHPPPTAADIQQARFGTCDEWVFQSISSNGYAGPIELLALWQAQDSSLTLRVTDHRETPGIGDFIDHTKDSWITQLDQTDGQSYANIDTVSGATITTDAIRRAAEIALLGVEDYCDF